MSAASSLRDHCLPYLNVQDSSYLDTATSAAILTALNQSLQEIFAGDLKDTVGGLVYAPTGVTLGAVTSGSKTITFAGYAARMHGCTIVINGDARQNRLEIDSSGNPELLRPYMGSTGSNVTAVVYGDAITLDVTVDKIYPPMELYENTTVWDVKPVDGLSNLNGMRGQGGTLWGRANKFTQRPQFYALENSISPGAANQPVQRIVFDSLPDHDYPYSFEATLAAPRVTSLSSDTRTYLIPNGYDEAVLWPWVLDKLLAFPDFIGDASDIQRKAAEAKLFWRTQRDSKGLVEQPIEVGVW